MNAEQIAIQLGVCGAVIWAVVKLGLRFIDRWSTTESERTTALSDGFKSLSGRIEMHHDADIASHQAMAKQLERIETRQDAATPAHGVRLVRSDTNPGER